MKLHSLRQALRDEIEQVTPSHFEEVALRVFRYQAHHNLIYQKYLAHLGVDPSRVRRLAEVPFFPIQFFKHHTIRTGQPPASAVVFESSGTTSQSTSRHTLYDPLLYQSISERIFEEQYGALPGTHLLALLPSYLERNNSSLVYMVRHFIEKTNSPYSGFYLHDTAALTRQLRLLAQQSPTQPIRVLGVTFALLDWAESDNDFSFLTELSDLTIMETGGMKGRRQELLREEVHAILQARLGVPSIHSEYGMTELLSQAYSVGEGIFRPGSTLRVLLRDPNDPFSVVPWQEGYLQTGGINVVDLANLDSCSFIETQDLGRFASESETFYVLGRFDNSDVRGCNLMAL